MTEKTKTNGKSKKEHKKKKNFQYNKQNNNQKQSKNNSRIRNKVKFSGKKLKIIPIGGLNEIGKNITAFEYGNDIIIVDCGMSFPDNDMLGIDVVIPDFTYLIKNAKKIRGLVITHGHEDHIGGVPYLLKYINVPIYGTRLPLGLIKNKCEEHGITPKLHNINASDTISLGVFNVETIRTTHSIADAICLSIDTPEGKIFHTGDFKIDYTPVDGDPIDLIKLAQLGAEGVLLMLSDSTNAMRSGFTESEMKVGNALETIFRDVKTRIIVSTFSSNVHRIQKIVDNAIKNHRRIAFSGRSMLNVVTLAMELGYLKIPKTSIVDINQAKNIPDKNLVIITTGSQGEPMSALARMANSEHKAIQIKKGDTVVLSSSPVPGNEKMVSNVVNLLVEKGAKVIYSDIADTHVSGHACSEELKLIHSLIKPKYFMPVHGECRHLQAAADIAMQIGLNSKNIFIMENGDVLELTSKTANLKKQQIPAGAVMVDGLGIGDVGNIVMRDRKHLSESGLISIVATIDKASRQIISGPEIITRGFIYVRENEKLILEARQIAMDAIINSLHDAINDNNVVDFSVLKTAVKYDMRRFIFKKTQRNPVILPIFMEV